MSDVGESVLKAAVVAGVSVLIPGSTVAFSTAFWSTLAFDQIGRALAPKPPTFDLERQPASSDITTLSPIDTHKIIYGKTLTGGTFVYSNLATLSLGQPNSDFLNLVIALAPHEIEGIQKVYVNSDVAIDLEVDDDVMNVTDNGIYNTSVQGGVTRTGTLPAGSQINLDGYIYDPLGGTYNYILNVGGTIRYNNNGQVHNFCYQNNTGSAQNYTLTVSSINVTAVNYTRLLISNFLVASDYKDLISFYPVYADADDYLTFLGYDVGKLPDPSFVSKTVAAGEWDTTHTMSGIAHIYVRIKYDTETLKGSVPNIACLVKGKKLFDPRNSTTVWSSNPALAIRDYLTNTVYGCRVDASEIDDEAIKAAANVCDETVTYDGTVGFLTHGSGTVQEDSYTTGKTLWEPNSSITELYLPFHVGDTVTIYTDDVNHSLYGNSYTVTELTENKKGFYIDYTWQSGDSTDTSTAIEYSTKRYSANGIADTGNSRKTNLDYLLTSLAGKLCYSNGRFRLLAGDYRAPTHTITENDMVSGIRIQTRPGARTLFNGVKGFYRSRNEDFVAKDFKPYINASALSDDNDLENFIDLPLRYTTNLSQANRLAAIAVERSRLFETVVVTVNASGLRYQVGDTVQLTYSRASISNKIYEIIDYQINVTDTVTVDLVLQEQSSSVWIF